MRHRTLAFAGALLLLVARLDASPSGLPLSGERAERFLRTAAVVAKAPIGVGITKPMKLTLRDDEGRTHHAVWKTVDEVRHGVHKAREGRFQQGFRDSYKYEVAAYELDKLLGLGLVPPTVERTIDGRRGSLQMWVEGAFTELDRRERSLLPDDEISWSDQQYKLRLLHQLTYNSDAANLRNVIYDADLRVYAIDHSRSFRRFHALRDDAGLRRFSREVLDALRELRRVDLERRLGAWLTLEEIEALLARRDLLLEHASELAESHGESAVVYP